ncbi:MAG: PAS domain S-box protein [Chloroflexota bacterium]
MSIRAHRSPPATTAGPPPDPSSVHGGDDRFRLLAERGRDVIFRYRLRPDRAVEYVSPSIQTLTGYTAAELYADPNLPFRRLHPEDRAALAQRTRDGRLFGEPILARWLHRDGRHIWLEQSNTEILDEDGRRIAIEGVARDATRSVEAREAIAASEARFRSALQDLKLHATIVDREGRIVFANPYLAERTGWTQAELLGRNTFDVFDSVETREAKRASYREAITSEVSVPTWESDWLTRDREVVRIAWSSNFVRDVSGRIEGIASVGEDVTKRQQQEAGHARLAAAVDQTTEAIVVMGPEGRIQYANPAFERSSGIKAADAVGRRPWCILPTGPAHPGFGPIRRELQAGRSWSGAWDLIRPDGSFRREEVSVTSVRDATGVIAGYVAVARDVTRIREIQDILDSATMQRARVARAMGHLAVCDSPEATGNAITDAIVDLPGVDFAMLLVSDGAAEISPLAITAPLGSVLKVDERLPHDLATHLYQRAQDGPWSQPSSDPTADWSTSMDGLAVGVTMLAFAPWAHGQGASGLIVIGTSRTPTAVDDRAQLSTAVEFAATTRTLVGPALAERGVAQRRRAEIDGVLRTGAFRAVFQPIVDMSTGSAIGYEALTRFDDGAPPDERFAAASRCGRGIELEAATLERAIADSMDLPAGPWISLNVSASMIMTGDRLATIVRRRTRPVVLEITEHDAIDDYGAVRDAVALLGPDVRIAVDDAGTGVANFNHIVQLRPDFVKIDASLVRGVDNDLTRQALIIGLHHFARTTNGWLVAEGVETEAERRALLAMGIDLGQGFLFARPTAARAWEQPQMPAASQVSLVPRCRTPHRARKAVASIVGA